MSQENEIEAKELSQTTDFLPSDGASCCASSAREPDLGEWLGPVGVKTMEDAALGIYNGIRWHMLTAITRDGEGFVEVLAATCIDGIGVIVRWKKNEHGWTWEAMDTEGGADWSPGEEEGNEIPDEPPTVWDDLPRHNDQEQTTPSKP